MQTYNQNGTRNHYLLRIFFFFASWSCTIKRYLRKLYGLGPDSNNGNINVLKKEMCREYRRQWTSLCSVSSNETVLSIAPEYYHSTLFLSDNGEYFLRKIEITRLIFKHRQVNRFKMIPHYQVTLQILFKS